MEFLPMLMGAIMIYVVGTRILTDCVRLSCATGTATAQTPGTELYHRAGVEAILPRVGLSFL